MTTITKAEEEAETKALERYRSLVGKVVEIEWVQGYIGDDSGDFKCDPPAKVKIVETDKDSILHWNDEWLDPYYDVELVEPHPKLAEARSLWIYGESYNLISGEISPARMKVLGGADPTPTEMRIMDGHLA